MNMNTRNLSVLLALQAVLVGGIYWNTRQAAVTADPVPLLGLNKTAVTALTIYGEKADESVQLQRLDQHWQLPGLQNLPASDSLVNTAIEHLAALQTGWPIATSSSSHDRFQVSDDHHQKILEVTQGDARQRLFLGTAPGMGKVNGRVDGDNNVYELALNAYDFSTNANDWLDKKLLALNSIGQISAADWSIKQTGDGWIWQGPAITGSEGQKLDQTRVKSLVDTFVNMRVLGLVEDAGIVSHLQRDEEVLTVTVTAAKTWHYRFYSDGKNAWVGRDDHQFDGHWQVFRVTLPEYKRIAEADFNRLKAVATAADTDTDPAVQTPTDQVTGDNSPNEQNPQEGADSSGE